MDLTGTADVAVVGGGVAGLACAGRLASEGHDVVLLEASDGVGGRVRTDVREGFLLDRGFQVYLSAYPVAGQLLDLEGLDLRSFRPGALVYRNGRSHRLMDAFRAPRHALSTALQPIGTFRDKLLVGKLRLESLRRRCGSHRTGDCTTVEFLQRYGFSRDMIDGFFRPFYGGIFLERDLRTSSRMFQFTFEMFARGHATVPARGMQEIPRQLANRLPASAIRLKAPVRALASEAVVLEDGSRIGARAVVVATDADSAYRLLPAAFDAAPRWRSVTGMYFAATRSPLNEAIIALNGDPTGLVNNVCVISDVAPDYSPDERALLSVSVLGCPEAPDLLERVRAELRSWFGNQVDGWVHLRTDSIRCGLPEQPPESGDGGPGFRKHRGVWLCGDHCTSASIEGAVISGLRTAESVLEAATDRPQSSLFHE